MTNSPIKINAAGGMRNPPVHPEKVRLLGSSLFAFDNFLLGSGTSGMDNLKNHNLNLDTI